MNIRLIIENDLPACAKLFQMTFNSTPWNENWAYEDALSRISDNFSSPKFIGFLAEQDSLLGFVLGNLQRYESRFDFELKEMCVKPIRQRLGIGSSLLVELQRYLQEKSVNSIFLLTAKDSFASKFYEKNKFRDAYKIKVMVNKK